MSYFLDLGPIPLPGNDFPRPLTLYSELLVPSSESYFHFHETLLQFAVEELSWLASCPQKSRGPKVTFCFVLSLSSLVQTGGTSPNTILLKTWVFLHQTKAVHPNLPETGPIWVFLGCNETTPLRSSGLLSISKSLRGSTLKSF